MRWNVRSSRAAAFVVTSIAVLAGGFAIAVGSVAGDRLFQDGQNVRLIAADEAKKAVEFTGIRRWLNTTSTLSMSSLKGRVVLLDFWSYTCLNCRHAMPYLARLHETYAPRGLVVVGVHGPEFEFGADPANIDRAIDELDITWPIADDAESATWRAYRNQYRPSYYLVDRSGLVRHVQFGEGRERVMEDAVRALLDDGGSAGPDRVGEVAGSERAPRRGEVVSKEAHAAGPRAGEYLEAGAMPVGETVVRADAGTTMDKIYLRGTFTGGAEWVAAATAGARLDMRHRARDVYAILTMSTLPSAGPGTGEVEVLLDGKPVPEGRRGRDVVAGSDGRTVLRLHQDDLHHLLTGPVIAEQTISLIARQPGVRFFVLKFGA